jgi:hypothetical protein
VPERRSRQTTIVVVSSAIATIALLGIFVLYLINTIGDDDGSARPNQGTTTGIPGAAPQVPKPAGGATGATGGSTSGGASAPPPAGATGGASGGAGLQGGGGLRGVP